MGIWLECIIGILAAYGLICIVKGIYAIIFTNQQRFDISAELFLYGDSADPRTEQLFNTCVQFKSQHCPRLQIVLVESGESGSNIPAHILCQRHGIEYIE